MMTGEDCHDLQDIFAAHFERTDIEGAKKWYANWRDNKDTEGSETLALYLNDFTERAMAGHISDYLEGLAGTEKNSYNASPWANCFLKTKYGIEIYSTDVGYGQ